MSAPADDSRPWTEQVGAAARKAAERRTGVVVGARDPGHGDVVAPAGLREAGTDEQISSDTLFEIGSITKVFTSLVLAAEVVAGRLTLDTPLRGALPPGAVVPERGGVAITLGHLATHRSGLPRAPVAVLAGSLQMLRGHDPYAGLRIIKLPNKAGRIDLP